MVPDDTPPPSAAGPATPAASDGSPLALARLPFVFTQDALLTTDEFIKRADDRGHRLDLATLSALHELGFLRPLFRVSDTAVSGRRIDVRHYGEMNARGWFFEAAATGRLRDVSAEGRSIDNPYERPVDEDHRWWNGFLYSSWQLMEVGHADAALQLHRGGIGWPGERTRSERAKPLIMTLCALATRHLPSILRRVSYPGGYDHRRLWRSRFDIGDGERLALVGSDPGELRGWAEQLLAQARAEDPMIEWLPLLRHAGCTAWEKLKGAPADAHLKRVAAEILLRAYEELAADGIVDALPELAEQGWRTPLHDRIGPRPPAESLDRALGAFGLSPHPRVVVLVEGDTEMTHFPRLLGLYGLDRPDRVRVQNAGGAWANPQLLAQYVASPRLGPSFGGHQFLNAAPTALVIAMDPENRWATAEKRDDELRKMRAIVRREVELQGGHISDDELASLIHVFVWGDHSYELANFSDAELADALVKLASRQKLRDCGTTAWRNRAERELAAARANGDDVSVAMKGMGVGVKKLRLAEALWPVLREAATTPEANQPMQRPVLHVLEVVRDVCSRLSASGGYALAQPPVAPET